MVGAWLVRIRERLATAFVDTLLSHVGELQLKKIKVVHLAHTWTASRMFYRLASGGEWWQNRSSSRVLLLLQGWTRCPRPIEAKSQG